MLQVAGLRSLSCCNEPLGGGWGSDLVLIKNAWCCKSLRDPGQKILRVPWTLYVAILNPKPYGRVQIWVQLSPLPINMYQEAMPAAAHFWIAAVAAVTLTSVLSRWIMNGDANAVQRKTVDDRCQELVTKGRQFRLSSVKDEKPMVNAAMKHVRTYQTGHGKIC